MASAVNDQLASSPYSASMVTAAAIPPLYASTFDDEFSSFVSSPRGGPVGWATELPFWGAEHTLSGNSEAEYYVDSSQANSPFSVSNGVLTIQATPASTSGGNPLGLAYNSGAITTYNSFSQLYGYFEIRAQLPAGAGLWPAFWFMPTNIEPGPELDAFEVLGDQPNTLYASVHGAGPQASLEQVLSVADTSTAFHTYGVDWGPQTTVFYMDGQAIATAPTPADMDTPMYMLLNLAVGGAGSWPGAPTSATQFPADFKIDYVHAFQTANTIGWTNPDPTAPSPLVLPEVQAAAEFGNAQAYVNVQHYGNEDGGTGQGGIGVALRNAAGLIVATGVTNAGGFYTFLNLAPGDYSVQYITPDQYSVRPGNFADATTGLTGSFTLVAHEDYAVPYQLVTSSAELAGTVQLDGTSAANAVVQLLNQGGTAISTTTTDSAGRFYFWAAAGQYSVEYDPPSGTKLASASLVDATTGLTAPIVLADGMKFLLIPEQLVSTAPAASTAATAPISIPDAAPTSTATATSTITPDAAPISPAVAAPISPAVAAPIIIPDATTISPAVAAPIITADATPIITPDAAPISTAVATPISTPNPVSISTEAVAPIATAAATPGTSTVVIAPAAASGSDIAVYRFFDDINGTQFLTASAAERDAIVKTRPDLVSEGVGIGAVGQSSDSSNAVPVYRFFDMQSGTHFYTSSNSERDDIIGTRPDLTFEGISFYEHKVAQPGDAAVYRFFDSTNGTHFYTSSDTERSTILASRPDMVPEGVSFYAPASS